MKIIGNEKGVEMRLYEKGEYLFREGEVGDTMFVLRRGILDVLRKSDVGKEILLAQLSDGAVVGEMALIDSKGRSASVVAHKNSVVLGIPKIAITRLLNQFPDWISALLSLLVGRLRESNHKMTQSHIQSPILSFAFYILKTVNRNTYPLEQVLVRYQLLSKIPNVQILVLVQELKRRGLVGLSEDDQLTILDIDLLKIFVDMNMCKFSHKPYPLLELSNIGQLWLRSLRQLMETKKLVTPFSKDEWETMVHGVNGGEKLQFSQVDPLKQMNVFLPGENPQYWILNEPLVATLVRTLDNLSRLELHDE